MRSILKVLAIMALTLTGGTFLVVKNADASSYCTTAQSCAAEVQSLVNARDRAAASGPQWAVSKSNCVSAARQQMRNETRCRAFDQKWGGKTLEECAQCYRLVREDIRRWEACYIASGRTIRRPPKAIYESLARLGKVANSLAR